MFAGAVLTHDGAIKHEATRKSVEGGRHMIDGVIALYIFMLAAFTGYEVISRVPVILHTPLMSGSNFVHGIVLVGAMVALGGADTTLLRVIGFIGVRARRGQRRRRLRGHRAHAQDVQSSGARQGNRRRR